MSLFSAFKHTIITGLFVIGMVGAPLLVSTVQAADDPSPAIWKLTDHDSEVWLFGSVHILSPDLVWRSRQINEAFAASDTIYFEAPANQSGMQALIIKHGIDKRQPLSTIMSSKAKANLQQALLGLNIPLGIIQQLEPMRPWLAGLTLAAYQIQAQGGDPKAGVERILQAEAKIMKKTVRYFETDQEQIEMLAGLSPEAELFFLEDGIKMMIEEPNLLEELIAGWVKGDVDQVDAAMIQSLQGQQELYAALLVNRNKKWAKQINTIMAGSGTVFIAVGAAHLAGGNSVQYYLGDYGLVPVRQSE